MYNYLDTGEILEFKLNNMAVRLAIMYKKTLEYLEL